MTVLLSFVWFIGIIASIWFLFKPNTKWPIYANRKRAVGMLAVFFFVPLILIGFISPASNVAATPSAPVAPPIPKTPEQIAAEKAEQDARAAEEGANQAKRNPEQFVSLENLSASKTGFDVVVSLSGRVKNTSTIDIKDPVIMCELFAESGTQLGTVRETLYKVVPAGDTIRFSELNMGFADSVWGSYRCDIIGADVA